MRLRWDSEVYYGKNGVLVTTPVAVYHVVMDPDGTWIQFKMLRGTPEAKILR